MPASSNWPTKRASRSRHVGATRDASSTMWPKPPSPLATEALRRTGELYAIEARIRGQSPDYRLAERRTFSKPIVDALNVWLDTQLRLVPGRSTLAEAIRYALSRWHGLTRFLNDGRVELDTNPVERAIRPVTLGRKTHLFASSEGGGHRWAVVSSLITTSKLNDVEPYAYLRDVLQRMIDGHPVNRLDELLPWSWSRLIMSRLEACAAAGRLPALRSLLSNLKPNCA
jgi:transposase